MSSACISMSADLGYARHFITSDGEDQWVLWFSGPDGEVEVAMPSEVLQGIADCLQNEIASLN